jgi:hypothetical protein
VEFSSEGAGVLHRVSLSLAQRELEFSPGEAGIKLRGSWSAAQRELEFSSDGAGVQLRGSWSLVKRELIFGSEGIWSSARIELVFSACKELGSPEWELEFRSKGAGVQLRSGIRLREEAQSNSEMSRRSLREKEVRLIKI